MGESTQENEYFLWGFEPHFRHEIEREAESLFARLDKQLEPRAFLVGFRLPGEDVEPAIYVEPPPSLFPYSPEVLADVPSLAEKYQEKDPRSDMMFGGSTPEAAKRGAELNRRGIIQRSWRDALKDRLSAEEDESGYETFVSRPAQVTGYRVLCVLQLRARRIERLPCLQRDEVIPRSVHKIEVPRSLVHASADVLLEAVYNGLRRVEVGKHIRPVEPSTAEILRRAASPHFPRTP